MSENLKPNKRRRRFIAGTATIGTAGLIVGGLTLAQNAISDQAKNSWDKTEQEALKNVNAQPKVLDIVLVLGEGTPYYTSPITAENIPADGLTDLAGRVKSGSVIRVDRPRTPYTDVDGNSWFTIIMDDNSQNPRGEATSREHTYWVPLNDPQTKISEFVYPARPSIGAPQELDAFINKAGNIAVKGETAYADRATIISTQIFTEMAQNEGLTPITQ